MQLTFILIAMIILLIGIGSGIIVILSLKIKNLSKENKDLKMFIEEQQENLVMLQDFQKGAKEIKLKNKNILKQIKEAKTDEESFFAIGSIINANNNRLPKSKQSS